MISLVRIVGDVVVVTATAYFHPLRQLNHLTEELDGLGFEGTVVFDLLAVNGIAPNRFASMRFINNRFEHSSFSIEDDISQCIKEEQDVIIKNDLDFLLGSVLSSSEVQEFVHT